ncbi:unnamed protein product [Didymodactylos carnosus]|uniref:Uncharacterized protein n=1 Tax=Didymodactylos carnosus TaxID=1234261 RepID=A0A8S2DR88_9BILA|nr:unnamed protein product [Didymodactylos carnosus]CAF3802442.1 unnamed protein product [Didymodactylos carnosus]
MQTRKIQRIPEYYQYLSGQKQLPLQLQQHQRPPHPTNLNSRYKTNVQLLQLLDIDVKIKKLNKIITISDLRFHIYCVNGKSYITESMQKKETACKHFFGLSFVTSVRVLPLT